MLEQLRLWQSKMKIPKPLVKIRRRIAISTPIKAFKIFPKSDQHKLLLVAFIQISLGFLDLLGIALIGILGALAMYGVQSKEPGNRVGYFLDFLNLDGFTLQFQVGILASIATLVLILKTISSLIMTRKTLNFLSYKSAEISNYIVSRLFNQPLLKIQSKSVHEHIYSITTGVNSLSLGVISTSINMLSDFSLLVIMCLGLIYVNPSIAIVSFTAFGLLGYVTYRYLNVYAKNLGISETKTNIEVYQSISNLILSYREIFVRGRRSFVVARIGRKRGELASLMAEISFLPNVSKYIVEIAIVLFALTVSAAQFLVLDASRAIATLAVFLAAGSRIAPALMRLQQGAIQIKGSIGAASPTLALLDELKGVNEVSTEVRPFSDDHSDFSPEIEIKNLDFAFSGSDNFAISNLSLSAAEGQMTALVGPSGAGKTTLIDLILGLHNPLAGEVLISGLTAKEAISKHEGAISYVPQDVSIFEGSIKENISFGYENDAKPDEWYWNILEQVRLKSFVEQLPDQLNHKVGDRGSRMSGGQRQRLGIARALFTNPKLLILDEATSALDSQTEHEITNTLLELRGKVTLLIIAHRLSTVRSSDLVVYLEMGRVVSSGTFEEVRKSVPEFESQAKLLGI